MTNPENQARHTLGNLITALESQVFLLERALTSNPEKTGDYIQRMKESLAKMRDSLSRLKNIAKSTD
ncbi:MAG: hypothetical protein N2691_05115 [Patescibacteria group bacterium]|nr:hypothetical protein [Patescibacteria group bacterium]